VTRNGFSQSPSGHSVPFPRTQFPFLPVPIPMLHSEPLIYRDIAGFVMHRSVPQWSARVSMVCKLSVTVPQCTAIIVRGLVCDATCTAMHRSAPQWSRSIPMIHKPSASFPQYTAIHRNALQCSTSLPQHFHNALQCSAMLCKPSAMFNSVKCNTRRPNNI